MAKPVFVSLIEGESPHKLKEIKEINKHETLYTCEVCDISGVRFNKQNYIEVIPTKKTKELIEKCKSPVIQKEKKIDTEFSPSELIAIGIIQESKTNPRTHWDAKALQELAESIKQHGILQPLIIRHTGKIVELVSGARRLRAAKLAGLKDVPCIIMDLTDDQAQEIQIIENLHREDVRPMEEAVGYQQLLNSGKYTVEALAEKVGKSTTYVYSRLRLNHLIDKFRKLFEKEWISYAIVRVICRHTNEFQEKLYTEFDNDNIFAGGFKEASEEEIKSVLPSQIEEFAKDNLYKNLKYAPFDLSDKILVKDKPCDTCKSNTACAGQLFPEYSKDKFCTDPKCYNEKVKNHIATNEKKLQEKKEDYVKVSTQYQVDKELKESGVLDTNHYSVCKKTDKGATKAIVVDTNTYNEGSQKKLGEVIYITTEKAKSSSSSSLSSSPGKSIQDKIKEARGKNNSQARFETLEKIRTEIKSLLKDKKEIPVKVKKLLLQVIFYKFDHDSKSKFKNHFKWDIQKKKNSWGGTELDYDKFFLDRVQLISEKSDNTAFFIELIHGLLSLQLFNPDNYTSWENKFKKEKDGLGIDFISSAADIFNIDLQARVNELNKESETKLKEKKKPAAKKKDSKTKSPAKKGAKK